MTPWTGIVFSTFENSSVIVEWIPVEDGRVHGVWETYYPDGSPKTRVGFQLAPGQDPAPKALDGGELPGRHGKQPPRRKASGEPREEGTAALEAGDVVEHAEKDDEVEARGGRTGLERVAEGVGALEAGARDMGVLLPGVGHEPGRAVHAQVVETLAEVLGEEGREAPVAAAGVEYAQAAGAAWQVGQEPLPARPGVGARCAAQATGPAAVRPQRY